MVRGERGNTLCRQRRQRRPTSLRSHFTTPAGEAAQVVHCGPDDQMRGAHTVLHQWCVANKRRIGIHSLEIYGNWSDDPAKLETTIYVQRGPNGVGLEMGYPAG